jgi:inosine-uridine nucleoside N-ribohydrolase
MVKIHLDTDLGGDIDDLCALAMLLRLPEVEIVGITTVAEVAGKRAGYVRHILALEQRESIPVAAGADVSLRPFRWLQVLLDERRYWGEQIPALANSLAQALALLKQSIEQGATVIGIGPLTNLALLEKKYPGILGTTPLFLMGGYIYPVGDGFPQMGNDSDYNIQADVESAQYVIEHSNPTLVPLTVTVETALRRAHLPTLRNAFALGQLLARQAEAFAGDERYGEKYGKTCHHVPDDIINFLHDPLACAIAVNWMDGVEIEKIPLKVEMSEGWLYERIDPVGKPMRVVTKIDGSRFNEFWVETISRSSPPRG